MATAKELGVTGVVCDAWYANLSAELGPRGVTANVISPGYIAGTDFFRGGLTEAREQGR